MGLQSPLILFVLSSAIAIIFWTAVARLAASGVMQGPELLSRLSFMIVCIISALYTGYFHYIMKLHN